MPSGFWHIKDTDENFRILIEEDTARNVVKVGARKKHVKRPRRTVRVTEGRVQEGYYILYVGDGYSKLRFERVESYDPDIGEPVGDFDCVLRPQTPKEIAADLRARIRADIATSTKNSINRDGCRQLIEWQSPVDCCCHLGAAPCSACVSVSLHCPAGCWVADED